MVIGSHGVGKEDNMRYTIHTIKLPMPFRMGLVNAYLIVTPDGHFLIDTGSSNARNILLTALEEKGCTAKTLKSIILTHGDFDHTGNAANLQSVFGAKAIMHRDDSDMAILGDMFSNRKKPNFLVKMLVPTLSGFGKAERFVPDILITGRHELDDLGFPGEIIPIPGHSKGSIGVLLSGGEFFCGDLFENLKKPTLNSIMDNIEDCRNSLERFSKEKITVIYPGHGKSFSFEEYAKIAQQT